MGPPLRLLVVEDSPEEAQLVVREVERGGRTVQWRRVDSEPALRDALAEPWDVALVDFVVPGFGGLEALALLRERGLDLPVIVVSGKITDEAAVGALKAGAQDFISKFDLSRLGPAIERELREAHERAKRARAEDALRFIAESGRVLAGLPLVPSEIVDELAHLVVPVLAHWCVVDTVEAEGGPVLRAAVAAVEPGCDELLHEFRGRYTPATQGPIAAAEAMRTRRPVVVPDAAAVAARALDDAHDELLRRLGTSAMLAVPLVARGHLLGALTLARTGGATYADHDAEVAEIVANRAALQLDNARLYEQTRKAATEAAKQVAAWEGVVTAMSDGILLLDGCGRVIYTNVAYERLTGHARSDARRPRRFEEHPPGCEFSGATGGSCARTSFRRRVPCAAPGCSTRSSCSSAPSEATVGSSARAPPRCRTPRGASGAPSSSCATCPSRRSSRR